MISCEKEPIKLVEGGLYANPREDGIGYTVVKILKIDDNGYHVKRYSNVFKEIPQKIDVDSLYIIGLDDIKEGEELGIGHLPIGKNNFESWKLTYIEKVEVKEDELEGYKMWREAKGGYW